MRSSCCLLFVVCIFVLCYVRCAPRPLLFVVRCLFLVICFLLFNVCSLLVVVMCVVWCMLFVVCCL